MIQLNLLPDVKIQYIKAQRTKRLVMAASFIVGGVSFGILAILFLATSFQQQHLNNLDKDIREKSEQLKAEKDIDRILTVQNQLGAIDSLHAQKPAVNRLGNFLPKLTPKNVTISNLEISFTESTVIIDGNAKSIKKVNEFIDTLKFTDYNQGDETSKAFSEVILASFQRSSSEESAGEDPVNYQITFSFDPVIFDNTKKINLTVPKTVTTQSSDRPDPDSIFQEEIQIQEGE